MPSAELIDAVVALESIIPAWDALAGSNGRPQMAPAWVIAWFCFLAAPGIEPRIVVVRDGGEMIGVAPFYVSEGAGGVHHYRVANIETCAGLSLLATPGREPEVAAAVASELCERATPRPALIAFEGFPADSPWPDAMRAAWPSRIRPPHRRYSVYPSPSIAMEAADFEEWLGSKSSNFRSQMRRARRKFEKAGGLARASTPETLERDVETFVRLHAGRWEHKDGASNLVAFGDRLAPMLTQVGRDLGPERFRLRILELGGEPVAALLFLSAGGHSLYLNCGWDEAAAEYKPALLALLDAVEESFQRGDRHIDLGLGTESYKLRFADGDDPVAWTAMLIPGRHLPRTAAQIGPTLGRAAIRDAAKRHLSEQRLERLRAAGRRVHL